MPTKKRIIPVFISRTMTLLPGEAVSISLCRKNEKALIGAAFRGNREVAILYFPDNQRPSLKVGQIGTLGRILSYTEGPNSSSRVVIEGIERLILERIERRRPYPIAMTDVLRETNVSPKAESNYANRIMELARQIIDLSPEMVSEEALKLPAYAGHGGWFADRLAAQFHFPQKGRQNLLEASDISERLQKLEGLLQVELEKVGLVYGSGGIADAISVKDQANVPRKYDPLAMMKKKINESHGLPEPVRECCIIELNRLENLSPVSAEFGTTRIYLEWLLSIPWGRYTEDKFALQVIERKIDRSYYGPQHIKRRIFERVAMRQLYGGLSVGSILCLAGVAGTGKASLARIIAEATGKEFIRISIGGMTRPADIKGIRRTYMGAMPGAIVRALRDAGTSDPVILIEDIDYFEDDSNAATAMVLMEAIDPRYNARFVDDYVGLPIDLSHVHFICTVKSAEDVPDIFGHRLEVIELPGYIEKEKIHIARKYLIPDVLKRHNLSRTDVKFSEDGLKKIIRNYTLEAGLLNFRRRIERICRFIVREKADRSRKKWIVNENSVEKFLGSPQFIPEKPEKSPEIGVAIGLAWTGLGGDLMIIEGIRMKGSGEVITTGSLGEVMKESITAANSYVRSKADVLGIDHSDFENFDIHIHFPSGAIPKDGPSAGVAVSLVIASVMSERPIPNDIAMTGEVTLRGRILQVGGIIEKISAAYRAGIRKVFIPKENKKDLKDLPEDILRRTTFIFVETVDEIFAKGLLDFKPSSYTLEKIFAKELERAKNRKRDNTPKKRISAKSRKKK